MSKTRLAVIIPCFNEALRIRDTYRLLSAYFRSRPNMAAELVFVDDGSTDGTLEVLCAIGMQDEAVRIIHYEQNRGKGYAVRQGLLSSRHFTKVVLDADLSIGVHELDRINFKGSWEIIKGRREFINEPLSRRVLGLGWHHLVRALTGLSYDTQAPFTVLRLPRQFYKRLTTDGFAYDVEILYKANPHRIEELPVKYHYAMGSKVTVRKTLRMIKEIMKIKKISTSSS